MRSITRKTEKQHNSWIQDMRTGQWVQPYGGMYGAVFLEKTGNANPKRYHVGLRTNKVGIYRMCQKTFTSYRSARDYLINRWMEAPINKVWVDGHE